MGAIFAVATVANAFGTHFGGPLMTVIAILAVMLGTINVVGGFAVTERMLQMFKKKEPAKK